MRKLVLIALALLVMFAMTSCATMFNDSVETINIDSQPQGATVRINGYERGKTPLAVMLENDSDYTIEVAKEGYHPAQAFIKKKIGANWVILDIVGWGIWGPLVDVCTGDWYELKPKQVMVTLQQQ